MKRPRRPNPIIARDAASGEAYELLPTTEIYRFQFLEPRSEDEAAAVHTKGMLARILYDRATYDQAMHKADELLAAGHDESRIEFVLADRDILEALRGAPGRAVLRKLPPSPIRAKS